MNHYEGCYVIIDVSFLQGVHKISVAFKNTMIVSRKSSNGPKKSHASYVHATNLRKFYLDRKGWNFQETVKSPNSTILDELRICTSHMKPTRVESF